MNINSVSPVSCKANLNNLKKLTVPLKDGTVARISANENYLEALITKGDVVLPGSGGIYMAEGVPSRNLWGTFERIQKNVKEGFDFFTEFCNTILK